MSLSEKKVPRKEVFVDIVPRDENCGDTVMIVSYQCVCETNTCDYCQNKKIESVLIFETCTSIE